MSTLLRVDPRTPQLRPTISTTQDRVHSPWTEADRPFADALRSRMGPDYSDEQVLATVRRARVAGFSDAGTIEASVVQAGTFSMRGNHTTGYAFVQISLDEVVPSMDRLQEASSATSVPRQHAQDFAIGPPGIRA